MGTNIISFASILVFLVYLLASTHSAAESGTQGMIIAGSFSAGVDSSGIPVGWQGRDFNGKNSFAVETAGSTAFLRVESMASATGLFREVRFDPAQYPIVSWNWRVSRVVSSGNEREKDADDNAARVFVIFKDKLHGGLFSKLKRKLAGALSGDFPAGVVICYVWSNNLAENQAIDSPISKRIRIVAVESGSEKVGHRVSEQRNVVEDFKRLFGAEPSEVVAVGVMTDTDQTRESVTAFYSEIVFRTAAAR